MQLAIKQALDVAKSNAEVDFEASTQEAIDGHEAEVRFLARALARTQLGNSILSFNVDSLEAANSTKQSNTSYEPRRRKTLSKAQCKVYEAGGVLPNVLHWLKEDQVKPPGCKARFKYYFVALTNNNHHKAEFVRLQNSFDNVSVREVEK